MDQVNSQFSHSTWSVRRPSSLLSASRKIPSIGPLIDSAPASLLDLGPDIAPRAAITDKGYDAKANRDGARRRGICPVIPFKSNAIDRPTFFPEILYEA
jgi:hypothetical protein